VLARPAAFRSLVLMCSGPAGLTGPRVALLPLMPPLLAHGTATLVAAMDQLNAADAAWLALDAPVQAFLRERMLAASPQALIGMADALTGEPDRVEELRATGLPVLVLHGAADDAWTPGAAGGDGPPAGFGVRRRAPVPPTHPPWRPRADGARAAGLLGSALLARRRGPVGGLRDLERPDGRAGRRGAGAPSGRPLAAAWPAPKLCDSRQAVKSASLRQRV
jgi:hypothetical protein